MRFTKVTNMIIYNDKESGISKHLFYIQFFWSIRKYDKVIKKCTYLIDNWYKYENYNNIYGKEMILITKEELYFIICYSYYKLIDFDNAKKYYDYIMDNNICDKLLPWHKERLDNIYNQING